MDEEHRLLFQRTHVQFPNKSRGSHPFVSPTSLDMKPPENPGNRIHIHIPTYGNTHECTTDRQTHIHTFKIKISILF